MCLPSPCPFTLSPTMVPLLSSLQPHWLPGFSCCNSRHYTRHSCCLEHSSSKEMRGLLPRFPQYSAQMSLSPWRLLWPPFTTAKLPTSWDTSHSSSLPHFSLNRHHCLTQGVFHLVVLFIVCLCPIEWKPHGSRDFCLVYQKCIPSSANSTWPCSKCSINKWINALVILTLIWGHCSLHISIYL